jgi:hypothetical protein
MAPIITEVRTQILRYPHTLNFRLGYRITGALKTAASGCQTKRMNSDARSSSRLDEEDGLQERAGGGAGLGLDVEEVLAASVLLEIIDIVAAASVVVVRNGGKLEMVVAMYVEYDMAALQTWGGVGGRRILHGYEGNVIQNKWRSIDVGEELLTALDPPVAALLQQMETELHCVVDRTQVVPAILPSELVVVQQ